MEELDQKLTQKTFLEASGRLYDSLSQPEKGALLNWRHDEKKRPGTGKPAFRVYFFCITSVSRS